MVPEVGPNVHVQSEGGEMETHVKPYGGVHPFIAHAVMSHFGLIRLALAQELVNTGACCARRCH